MPAPNGQQHNGNNNVEQFSVNVTITKVGNQLISSRVDSKWMHLRNETFLDLTAKFIFIHSIYVQNVANFIISFQTNATRGA